MLQYSIYSSGGRYFRARDTEQLAEIYALLDKLEPVERGKDVYRPVTELYIWPLGLALACSLLLLAEPVLPLRRHP